MQQRGDWISYVGYLTLAVIIASLGLMVGESVHRNSGAGHVSAQEAKENQPVDKSGGGPVAYVGARIHTASGPAISRGVLLVQGGKILDVGAEGKVGIPAKA